ncbi:DUF3109 domain-containing protein [Taibaiella sp. KBW10]|nr:DUF3109 domain-containing protein [Taibaiella sp. KBW10]
MVAIEDILISDDIFDKQFVCDLNKCKGGCCVEGDAGAPITRDEANLIEDLYPVLKPYLPQNAINIIEEDGAYTFDDEFDIVTPTIDGGICVYGFYDEGGMVKCAIEQAYYDGKTDFKKPISCHLFPIRVVETETFHALNYEPQPSLCKPACKLGKSLKVPVYQFLKEPLIRKYGAEFYEDLEHTANEYYKNKEAGS